jgi:hypothetical protein
LLQGSTLLKKYTTDALGKYLFAGLPNGTYSVRVAAANYAVGGVLFNTASSKWFATKVDQGVDPAIDSDAAMHASLEVSVCCNENP